MISYNVFPGGKKRVVTFSYDDGRIEDKRLVELFNKYNVKASFHLNGNMYLDMTDEELAEVSNTYKGHEISCHTLYHGWPAYMISPSVVTEVMEDRKILEKIAGYPVIGMSYPFGSYNAESITAMKACGIVYSRTVNSTKSFHMPKDFMEWHPTCHHRDAKECCNAYIDQLEFSWPGPMLYIWGHSYEFRTEEDWTFMEEIVSSLAKHSDKIWFATNMEIYNYIEAQKRLRVTADETVFYNPTDTTIWVEKNRKEIIKIDAGETVRL